MTDNRTAMKKPSGIDMSEQNLWSMTDTMDIQTMSPKRAKSTLSSLLADLIETPQTVRIRVLVSCLLALLDVVTDLLLIREYGRKSIRKNRAGGDLYGFCAGLLIFIMVFSNVSSLLYHRYFHVQSAHGNSHNHRSEDNRLMPQLMPGLSNKLSTMRQKSNHSMTMKDFNEELLSTVDEYEENGVLPSSPITRGDSVFTVGDDSNFVLTGEGRVITPYMYDSLPWFHTPLFLSGLGTIAVSIECLKRGVVDQSFMETRYLETLLESVPSTTVQMYVLTLEMSVKGNGKSTSLIQVISMCLTLINVAQCTTAYFSRNFSNGNILEMTPIIFSLEMSSYLAMMTATDLFTRVMLPLFLIRAMDNFWLGLFIVIALVISETVMLRMVHGDWTTLALSYGWLSTFTASVFYFAAVGTRFQNLSWMVTELITRGVFGLLCYIISEFALNTDWPHFSLWSGLVLLCFIISNLCYALLIYRTLQWYQSMRLPLITSSDESARLGTRDFNILSLSKRDLGLENRCCLRNRSIL